MSEEEKVRTLMIRFVIDESNAKYVPPNHSVPPPIFIFNSMLPQTSYEIFELLEQL